MHRRSWCSTLSLVSLLASCGGDGKPAPDAAQGPPDGGDVVPDAGAPDAGAPAAPFLTDAVDCGTNTMDLADGMDLQRLELDLGVFPDALCNDGTGAVIYFRPYGNEANRNNWVIQLQGGGNCRDADDCARRWCSVGTNFSRSNMTASTASPGTPANGILERRADNPLGHANHVFVQYCSSDSWTGTVRDLVVSGVHPVDLTPIEYRIHFLGARILDAALATLRREGVGATTYTIGGASVELPDLDDADNVILAGASAGGAGTIQNGDRVGALLRETNPDLGYGLIIDSAFTPYLETLDFSTTACPQPCDWEDWTALDPRYAFWNARLEDTCETWHAANDPAAAWKCNDQGHVLRNHVTSPMLVRMGQRDSLISDGYIEAMFTVPGQGLMTLELFAELIRTEIADFAANLPVDAEEASDVAIAPAVFSPSCPDHETLRSTPATFGASIEVDGADVTMFDVFLNWITGGTPTVAITPEGGNDVCP